MPVGKAGTVKGQTQQALADLGVQILELLQNPQRDFSLTYLLISHSLPVVGQLATRIAVMQGGRIVETGPAEQVLRAPRASPTRKRRSPPSPRRPLVGINIFWRRTTWSVFTTGM
jgi:ABC-type dipeptide/oligopeptide/nickel transport system ATPase component